MSMVFICISSNSFGSGLHLSAGLHLNSGKKRSSIFGEDLFSFFGLHLHLGKKCSIFGEDLFFRSYIADLKRKVFFFSHGCEVALTSHICCPIRLVFHQHLISHIAYPGIPPEPSNHTRGQFLHLPSYPLLRLL